MTTSPQEKFEKLFQQFAQTCHMENDLKNFKTTREDYLLNSSTLDLLAIEHGRRDAKNLVDPHDSEFLNVSHMMRKQSCFTAENAVDTYVNAYNENTLRTISKPHETSKTVIEYIGSILDNACSREKNDLFSEDDAIAIENLENLTENHAKSNSKKGIPIEESIFFKTATFYNRDSGCFVSRNAVEKYKEAYNNFKNL